VLCDAGNEDSVKNAFKQIREQLGDPEVQNHFLSFLYTEYNTKVLIYNAGGFKRGPVKDLSAEDFHNVWKVGCFGGLLAAQQVLPAMEKHGKGTVLYTGATASLRGSAMFAAFASAKFGLRALVRRREEGERERERRRER
jgi:NAD(P)-dependent dehydrogenase (short-subunit alcohol dehydrogenase family)